MRDLMCYDVLCARRVCVCVCVFYGVNEVIAAVGLNSNCAK